jgi:hypothetical protein
MSCSPQFKQSIIISSLFSTASTRRFTVGKRPGRNDPKPVSFRSELHLHMHIHEAKPKIPKGLVSNGLAIIMLLVGVKDCHYAALDHARNERLDRLAAISEQAPAAPTNLTVVPLSTSDIRTGPPTSIRVIIQLKNP